MFIRANNKTVEVKTVVSDELCHGNKMYPALRFVFSKEVTQEDINILLSGRFEICDDNGNVLGVHEGYNMFRDVSVVIGKVTTEDQRIAELEAALAAMKAEKDELQNAVDVIVGGSAE